jgi:hypothetical protein
MEKRYKIESLVDLATIVTEENVHNLATDIHLWLTLIAKCKKEGLFDARSVSPLEWIDDGKHDLTVGVAGPDGVTVGTVVFSAKE